MNPGPDTIDLASYTLEWCAPPCKSWTLAGVPLSGYSLPPRRAAELVVCNTQDQGGVKVCNISTGVLTPIASSVVGLWRSSDDAATKVLIDVVGDVGHPLPKGSTDGWAVCGGARATADGLGALNRKSSVVQGVGGDWPASAGTSMGDCEWE